MSTVILLSSSPPRVFARSPTPADSSSPLPSTAALIQDSSPGRRKFKTKVKPRDGFSTTFSTARQVLAEKIGAENTIVASPGRYRFRSSQDGSVEDKADGKPTVRRPQLLPKAQSSTSISTLGSRPTVQLMERSKMLNIPKPQAETDGSTKQKIPSPEKLLLQRVTTRKTDWIPPNSQLNRQDEEERPVEYSAGSTNGMLSNLTHADDLTRVVKPSRPAVPNPAKRRRIEPVDKLDNDSTIPLAPTLVKANSMPAKTTLSRNRSPAKKALTITSLATSNYLGLDEPKESMMMQYLTSTQAQLQDTSNEPGLETKIQKTKAAVMKLKRSKKNQSKSLLLSPESAMKTFNEQEAIFGSASQLAREESPAFLRETIEAMRESESFLVPDPFSSPQQTQPVSIENTPKTGTSRFRKTRNLWSAAGRDEDNALLHVDMVDLTDTPAIRTAFTGKDVLLQPTTKAVFSKPGMLLRGGYSPLTDMYAHGIVDIDNINTPCQTSTRAFSTARKATSPRKSPTRVPQEADKVASPAKLDADKQVEPPPPKPNYAGFSIHDLNKQIKSYGFKAMRKREKMIELLDRCWEEKYGVQEPKADAPKPAPFGDFLDKVHGISARPEPKVKKARVRKKKDDVEKELKEKPARKPRKKKEAENSAVEGIQEKPKVQRKRKPKAVVISEGSVHDVDSILATVPEEFQALERFEDWAKPERKSKKPAAQVRAQARAPLARPDTIAELEQCSTPSDTLPLVTISDPSPPLEKEQIPSVALFPSNESIPETTNAPIVTSVNARITAAIMHQSECSHPGRNHNSNPTWHEKILLYDPIILEDLAAWLNTEGLGAVGEDSEISALEVREWCESQGICCLWRGGWRGNKAAQQ